MRTSVLLVEENDEDAALIARIVADFGAIELALERVTTTTRARQQLDAHRYDAVLFADVGGADSAGAVTFLQSAAGGAPIVVLLPDSGDAVGREAERGGAQAYVQKNERGWQSLPLTIAYAIERARREQEVDELTRALAHAGDAIATIDGGGVCVAANAALQGLLGYHVEELLETPLREFVHEADRPRLAAARSAPALEEIEVRTVRKDGRIVPTQLSFLPRSGGRGYFCFVRDLTRQKYVEGNLVAAAAVTAVGSLASGLAHEINNPLAVVLANVEEAARVTEDMESSLAQTAATDIADLRAMLEEAHSASQRVQRIVRDLRVFAVTDDRRARVDVNAILESCTNIAFAEIRHRARLVKDLKAKVPVFGSEPKLAQLFLNLLTNASQAIPEGQADANEITIRTEERDRSTLVIEISDTGAGIEPTQQLRVFEPFFTTKARRPGMGLVICQATVAAHGGEMVIEPREGGGTIVRVALPTFDADAVRGGDARRANEPQQRRVLVVDDDPFVLRALTRVLARDFDVAAARNGREALDLVRAGGTYDAMLCDLMMPELSGIELHELLAEDDPELAKRTIFLTGGSFSVRAQTFLDEVGQPHLAKPIDLKTVRELLLELSQPPHKDRSVRS